MARSLFSAFVTSFFILFVYVREKLLLLVCERLERNLWWSFFALVVLPLRPLGFFFIPKRVSFFFLLSVAESLSKSEDFSDLLGNRARARNCANTSSSSSSSHQFVLCLSFSLHPLPQRSVFSHKQFGEKKSEWEQHLFLGTEFEEEE